MRRVAILTTDNREHHRRYDLSIPYFGPAIEALFQGLRNRNDLEIHVLSCSQKPMSAPERLASNIWFHLLHVPKLGWLRTGYQGCIRAVRKKLQEIQPDVVHGQGTERDCSISAVLSGYPNVITIHGNMRAIARTTNVPIASYWWLAALLEELTLPRTLGVLCNSRHTQLQVETRARRTWLVPNAIRKEFFSTPLRREKKTVKPILLSVGTISPLKRQTKLLGVAEVLHREGHLFEVQFIGPANKGEKYATDFLKRVEIARRRGFADYLGTKSLPELIDALDSASALIHAPSEEAFGLVVAEALARNLKFFGTKIGGLTDIAHGVEGTELFDLHDEDKLHDAIAVWLKQGYPQPTNTAAKMRACYHPDLIAARHAEIYQQIANAR